MCVSELVALRVPPAPVPLSTIGCHECDDCMRDSRGFDFIALTPPMANASKRYRKEPERLQPESFENIVRGALVYIGVFRVFLPSRHGRKRIVQILEEKPQAIVQA